VPTHHVNCSVEVTDSDTAWASIRDFKSEWHPDIVKSHLSVNASGSIVREFTASDGGVYREQRTYFSDTDRRLCYAMTDGIDEVENYQGEVSINNSSVLWCAQFVADNPVGVQIAQGTEHIVNNGLAWLKQNPNVTKKMGVEQAKNRTPLQYITVAESSVNSPNLSVLTTAAAEDPCWTLVLFLHGIGGNANNWIDQLNPLGTSCVAAAIDFRGYGKSSLGSSQTRIDDYCDDIIRVMQQFGARKLVLVGLSMGSWIATSFAMRHPQLLSGLVLAGGCTGMSEADTSQRENFLAARSAPLAAGKTPADFASDVVDIIAGPAATKSQRKTLHRSMASISSNTYLDALTCFTQPVEKFDFSRIQCPVLLMTGEHDRLAPPEEIRQISLRIFDEITKKSKLPDVCFEVIKGAGHLCNVENPKRFNSLLMMFLDRIPGAIASKSPGRQSRREAKIRRIMDASLHEFSAKGYDGVSMDSIAERAEVSKPTLYQYFDDKEGLFAAVLQEGCEQIITPLSAPDGSLVDRLWNFSWVYANFVLRADMLSLARLVLGEATRRPQIAEAYHKAGPGKAFKGLVGFITECQAAGEIDVDDVEHAAQDLWSLILSGPRDHHLHFVNQSPDSEHLLASIGHGLRTFLKVYSTEVENDLAALTLKIDCHQQTLRSSGE